MDPELTALAATAATTVVQLLATESWEKAKSAVGWLWGKVHPERAAAVVAELEETRGEVLTARESGDEQAEQELIGDWRRRLARLLREGDPQLADELRRLLDELAPHLPETGSGSGGTTVNVNASDNARAYVAGRDLHITER
ncbi:hypothetical protein ACIRYZ_36525 [Kitasatospora sp. NPDC101155]|uniref:hypothetical protein n=1 Tax=Kitasatospora TaxID=2063 RepID=UPI0033EE90BF